MMIARRGGERTQEKQNKRQLCSMLEIKLAVWPVLLGKKVAEIQTAYDNILIHQSHRRKKNLLHIKRGALIYVLHCL